MNTTIDRTRIDCTFFEQRQQAATWEPAWDLAAQRATRASSPWRRVQREITERDSFAIPRTIRPHAHTRARASSRIRRREPKTLSACYDSRARARARATAARISRMLCAVGASLPRPSAASALQYRASTRGILIWVPTATLVTAAATVAAMTEELSLSLLALLFSALTDKSAISPRVWNSQRSRRAVSRNRARISRRATQGCAWHALRSVAHLYEAT